MSKIEVDAIEPQSGTSLTLGASGDTITIPSGATLSGTSIALSGNIGIGGATPTASGTGITFPATASGSTNANTLDDYEEGTFTPALVRAGVTFTYSGRGGTYTKIGDLVTTSFYMTLSTHDGSTSATATDISGFPFTSSASKSLGSFVMFNNNTGTIVGEGRTDNATTTIGVMTATIATDANLFTTLIYRV
jgi:hypothetical protein